MKVLFCASEVVPFAKTGGLADVAGSLPAVLESLGAEVKIIMPRYKMVNAEKFKLAKFNSDVSVATVGKKLEIYFLENPKYFERDGLYQVKGEDYPDNLERFTYYCQETLKFIKKINFKPDVIHCNDWQTALIPVYLKTVYKKDSFYKDVKTVFTIHNLGYQGLFNKEQFPVTGLDWDLFGIEGLEFYGKVNILKGGLLFSDKITAVSPTYAKEIQTQEFGCGLEGVLQRRQSDVVGILNGISYEEWNPLTNKSLAKNYGPQDLNGKYANKADLQKTGGLSVTADIPLFGMITRLADQKGLDIFSAVIDEFCSLPLQFVLLGTGDKCYHDLFAQVSKKYKNTAIYLTFDPVLAYKIYAGSDMFLMPSRYEPCGLGQLISLKFGTIPVVRKTGGLADTVIDYDPHADSGNGFVFSQYEAGALLETVKRSLVLYNNKTSWKNLVSKTMGLDFSWEQSAKKYLELYKEIKA